MHQQISEAEREALAERWDLPHNFIPSPVPALDGILHLEVGCQRFVVLALPWEPGGETPFHLAQAAAKAGANPLCLFPSWSPYWDGTLNVRRVAELPAHVEYRDLDVPNGTGLIIIDQFSRLHWGDGVLTHADRADRVKAAGRSLVGLGYRTKMPVLVIVRRKGKGPDMSTWDLRSDGDLEYDTDALVMVDPDHMTGQATVNVTKARYEPMGVSVIDWPVLPRTVYRKTQQTS